MVEEVSVRMAKGGVSAERRWTVVVREVDQREWELDRESMCVTWLSRWSRWSDSTMIILNTVPFSTGSSYENA